MIKLSAKIRKETGKKVKKLIEADMIPAVIYGPETKNGILEVKYNDFKKVFDKTGGSSLISLEVEGEKKERPVLIHDIQKDPVTGRIKHIDFYQASMKQEVEVTVPLIFEGVSLAVKDLGGTLIKEIQDIKVKALPQDLPQNIKVDISVLKTFEDEIMVKDLNIPGAVKISRKPDDVVATVVPQQKIEEDLAKPIEEKVEDVEKVEKEKKVKEEEIVEEKPVAAPKTEKK